MSDRDADFLEYVTAHRGRMLRTARLLTCGDAHWAEDLVQVALTRLYVHWGKVRREDGAAGKNEAVISLGDKRNGLREVHVRQGKSTRLVAVSNQAYNLAWDEPTLLKFAGSCHYK